VLPVEAAAKASFTMVPDDASRRPNLEVKPV
jgi:hypothetical protein